MLQNEEVLYLVRQCKRAGTVQILSGHDSNSFIDTMRLVRNRPKAEVNLCHIAPVGGKKSIGLFHIKNLFWGGTYQNKKLGNKQLGKGLSIQRSKLKPKWSVSKDTSTNDILIKIEEYLGDVVADYIRESPIRKSKKAQIAQKIIKIEPANNFQKLMELSYTELLNKWTSLSSRGFTIRLKPNDESKYIVYIDEVTRFMSYNPKNKDKLIKLRRVLFMGYIALEKISHTRTYNKDFIPKYWSFAKKYRRAQLRAHDDWSKVKDLIYETSFRALQGEEFDISSACKVIKAHMEFSKSNPLS